MSPRLVDIRTLTTGLLGWYRTAHPLPDDLIKAAHREGSDGRSHCSAYMEYCLGRLPLYRTCSGNHQVDSAESVREDPGNFVARALTEVTKTIAGQAIYVVIFWG